VIIFILDKLLVEYDSIDIVIFFSLIKKLYH